MRIPVIWNGLTGLPGVGVFYGDTTVSTAPADLVTFFNAIKGLFPSGLSWAVPSSGDLVNDNDGSLAGTWASGGGATVTATGGPNPYAAGVGCAIRWNTAGVVAGRRVRGRTFLTGALTGLYDTNGTLTGANVTTLQNAANALVASGSVRIWSRPTPSRSGDSFTIAGAIAQDQVTSLRSRRI
jgi:hypothetical protein